MDRRVAIASQVAIAAMVSYFIYRTFNARKQQPSLKEAAPSSATPLTRKQIELIRATVPILQEHGASITTTFYRNMLTEHPELNNVFNTANQVNGHQARVSLHLAGQLQDRWELPAGSHGGAYWALANIMIARKGTLYKESQGWTNWCQFRVARKVRESDEITSFYLRPVDGKPLPSYKPGQYISVRVDVLRLKYPQARQSSLSDAPRSDYYRIGVKECGLNPWAPGAKRHPGYVSNVLHDVTKEGDVVEGSHPCGDFLLSSTEAAHPILLRSAGVGVTPLISILNTITNSPSNQRRVHFIHGSRSSQARAFKYHVQALEEKLPTMQVTLFTSTPSDQDQPGVDYHRRGRVDLQ
ncbi:flavohemoprotein [Aspergillus udagawae]|nr:flavohemoprotein [Aspergillus udagawae]